MVASRVELLLRHFDALAIFVRGERCDILQHHDGILQMDEHLDELIDGIPVFFVVQALPVSIVAPILAGNPGAGDSSYRKHARGTAYGRVDCSDVTSVDFRDARAPSAVVHFVCLDAMRVDLVGVDTDAAELGQSQAKTTDASPKVHVCKALGLAVFDRGGVTTSMGETAGLDPNFTLRTLRCERLAYR